MPTAPIQRMLAVLPLVSLLACGRDSAGPSRVVPTQAQYSFAQSEWSAPVNIGAPINSTAGEMNAALSPDELSLYFTSDRAGGLGITDIWVSHRDCGDCLWQTPVNLGAPFNSSSQDAGPRLSIDGLLQKRSSRRIECGRGYLRITSEQSERRLRLGTSRTARPGRQHAGRNRKRSRIPPECGRRRWESLLQPDHAHRSAA